MFIFGLAFGLAPITGSRLANAFAKLLQTAYDYAAQSEIPVTECEVLTNLYETTGGDQWNYHTGWMVNQ